MTNIWGFLSQTIYVSAMAAIILGLKYMLKDKLSARWQYGVWGMLVFCLFIPVGSMGGYIIPVAHVLLEAVKTMVETGLSSVYSNADTAVYNIHTLPYISAMPVSITDIMFVIYVVGLVLYLIKYFMGYLRLRKIIAASPLAGSETQAFVDKTAQKYNLASCNTKIIDGLPSAFVFGIIHPVLVLPQGIETDEKVILHELLHLKNKDLWQNVFWSLAKAFHWPNLFMQFVFRTIHNDMESLCDFRVMELLEGEDRREYGRILLSMTNEKYPSAFGTTSISNGGHFIAERIQAIARFKKYPQGMGVVAVCIVAMLFPLALKGMAVTYFDGTVYTDETSFDYHMALAKAQMARCTTVAGAIDTYAKAFVTDYDLYRIAVTPEETTDYQLPEMPYYNMYDIDVMYFVLNMVQTETGGYTAQLMFKEFIHGDEYGTNYYIIPVEIIYEKGWKVRQTEDYSCYYVNSIDHTYGPPHHEDYTGMVNITQETDYGTLKITGDSISFTSGSRYDTVPVTDLEFDRNRTEFQTTFILKESCYGFGSAAIGLGKLNDMEFTHDYEQYSQGMLGNQHTSMASSNGYGISNYTIGEDFDGVLWDSLIYDREEGEFPVGLQFDLWLGWDHYQTLKIDLQTGEVYEQNI